MRHQKRKKRNSRTRDFEAQNIRLGIKILTVDRMKCIVKVANNLRISQKTKYEGMDLMEEVIDKEATVGKQPNAMAATVSYLSSLRNNERITFRSHYQKQA
jgi:transcription initiation factor TFIIIB Brf1 subunit/transcription initiation factor TFIIB